MRILLLQIFFLTILPLVFSATKEDPIRVWHCANPDIKDIVDNAFELYKTDVDSILYYLKQSLSVIFSAYGGEWLISASRIVNTYDYIDDNDRNSEWFCTIYDKTYDVLIIVIRMRGVDSVDT